MGPNNHPFQFRDVVTDAEINTNQIFTHIRVLPSATSSSSSSAELTDIMDIAQQISIFYRDACPLLIKQLWKIV